MTHASNNAYQQKQSSLQRRQLPLGTPPTAISDR